MRNGCRRLAGRSRRDELKGSSQLAEQRQMSGCKDAQRLAERSHWFGPEDSSSKMHSQMSGRFQGSQNLAGHSRSSEQRLQQVNDPPCTVAAGCLDTHQTGKDSAD